MINSLGNRVRPTDTAAVLKLTARIIDESGIVQTLESAAKTKGPAGAPPRYGQYTARGVLIAMFHAVFAGRPASLAEVCALIWTDYTDDQLKFIGMPDIRTTERLAVLTADAAAWRNEHQRLWQFVRRMLDPMDDTPRAANARTGRTASKAAQQKAAITMAPQTELRRKVLNDLITATIDRSLLDDWKGDLAIDEHVVHVSKAFTNYYDDKGMKASATPMANFYKKQNRVGAGWSVGLTRAVATSRPYGRRVPTVCVALDINGSSPGSAEAAKRCLDQFKSSPIRPTKGRNDRTHLVTDQAYSRTTLFNADVLERGYTLLMHYPNDARIRLLHDLGRVIDPEETEPGPFMYRGTILCPAAAHLLRQAGPEAPTPGDTPQHAARFNEHQEALRHCEMPLNGLPQVTINRAPGRPSKTTTAEPERVIKLRVQCPAAKGKVRCAIRSAIQGDGSFEDPATQRLPDLSGSAPIEQWPLVCENANTTIVLTPRQFTQYQPVMEGSWEHQDWMSCNRSRDEGFNSVLTSTEGGNLQDRSVYGRRNPMVSLTIAFSVARANIKIQERWREAVRNNGGVAPNEPRVGQEGNHDGRVAAA
ncbi:hypothetical protein [Pedococcus bigeumensis]|uniref:Uncharacterized protein n=1 Tax=Pedococcus bigeumensis TaxID=433644 RepID=A0A502CWJ2_9MICO|nr:hypothetical protein [Pedococcus bigeumensis]TPG17183.1 hypothetical protein EAH86_10495 [Pedococcus bigeumensis]